MTASSDSTCQAADREEPVKLEGLLCGLNAYCLRWLCESPWNGGMGLTPQEVGGLTLDQVFFLLTPLKEAQRWKDSNQTIRISVEEVGAVLQVEEGGYIRGRDAEGLPMKARIGEVSLAQQIIRQQQGTKAGARNRRKKEK